MHILIPIPNLNPYPYPNASPHADQSLFGEQPQNELVTRIQPNEALYLPCISPVSPLYLPLYLACISPASPLYLPCISPKGDPDPAERGHLLQG